MTAKRHFASYIQKREIEVALRANMAQLENGFFEYLNDMSDEKIAHSLGANITEKMVRNMRNTLGFKTRAARYLASPDLEKRVADLEQTTVNLRAANEKMMAKLAEIEGLL